MWQAEPVSIQEPEWALVRDGRSAPRNGLELNRRTKGGWYGSDNHSCAKFVGLAAVGRKERSGWPDAECTGQTLVYEPRKCTEVQSGCFEGRRMKL